MAAGAVVAQGAAVQLEHMLAARGLVQAVDVLGDDGGELARGLEPGQPQVGRVGLCIFDDEFLAVKAVELLRLLLEKGVGEDGLGRVGVVLVVEAVHAAEVRDAALGGDARPAEKDDAVAGCDELFEGLVHGGFLSAGALCKPARGGVFLTVFVPEE